MKLLLTSMGISNPTIASSLDSLTSISRGEVKIGFVPTSANIEPGNKDWFLRQLHDLSKFNYTWIDIVDFSASDIDWQSRLSLCDVIYISGGNTFHLLNETRKYGFDKWIKKNLDSKVFIGSSAGSILFTPTIAIATVEPADTNYAKLVDLSALNLVDFEISPHTPEQLSYEANEKYANKSKNKLYALDDNTAIQVVEGDMQLISEGQWRQYN